MFSRKSLTLFLLTLLSAFGLGCHWQPGQNLNVGEKNPNQGDVSVDFSRYSCMSEVGKKVTSYLNGDMSDNEIRAFTSCVKNALFKFQNMTRGVNQNYYKPEELAAFLNRYYLRDQKILPDFVHEIMAAKVILLGGDETTITRVELAKQMDLVDFVEKHALLCRPYTKLYSLSSTLDKSKITRQDLDRARDQMNKSAVAMAQLLSSNGKVYTVGSLQGLMIEVRKFLRWDELHEDHHTPDQLIAIFQAFKEVTTGNSTDSILPGDWTQIFDSMISLYSLLVNYEIKLKGEPIMYGPGLDILISSFNDSSNLLSRIIKQNPRQLITFAATNKLFSALANVHSLPFGIREESLRNVYTHLITKGFQDPKNPLPKKNIEGLSLVELSQIRLEFKLWSDGQRYLSDNAKRSLGLSFGVNDRVLPQISHLINSFDFEKFIKNKIDSRDLRSQEIEKLVKSIRPLFKNGDNRAWIIPQDEIPLQPIYHGMYDLTRLNIINSMVRLLIRSFAANDRILTMAGVTESEMENFYETSRSLGEDLKFMDPRKVEVGIRSYIEGNIFTFSGDGINPDGKLSDRLLTFNETIELISMMWSGGQVRDRIYTEVKAACLTEGIPDGPLDVFNESKIDRACFNRHFFDNKLKQFSNLPHLKSAVNQLEPKAAQDMLNNIETIAKIPCENQQYFELAELATVTTVMHYVEVIFSIYDRDKNDVLDAQEIMRAFKRFNGYLARQIKIVQGSTYDVSMLKAIYAFLISNQALPTKSDAAALYWYKWHYFNDDPDEFKRTLHTDFAAKFSSDVPIEAPKNLPDMSIDRPGIIKVLKVLAGVSPTKMRVMTCRQ